MNNSQPRKHFKYLPILPRIKRMYSAPAFAQLLQQHSVSNLECPTVIHDIHQSPFWRKLYSSDGQFHGDLRAISFGLCTDGMNPFSKEKLSYSMWPITLTILNLPNHVRTKFASLHSWQERAQEYGSLFGTSHRRTCYFPRLRNF